MPTRKQTTLKAIAMANLLTMEQVHPRNTGTRVMIGAAGVRTGENTGTTKTGIPERKMESPH
eukprot:2037604-Heterocapsa_arctica.AAC.1